MEWRRRLLSLSLFSKPLLTFNNNKKPTHVFKKKKKKTSSDPRQPQDADRRGGLQPRRPRPARHPPAEGGPFPDLEMYTDVALDPYNSDGHDGIVRGRRRHPERRDGRVPVPPGGVPGGRGRGLRLPVGHDGWAGRRDPGGPGRGRPHARGHHELHRQVRVRLLRALPGRARLRSPGRARAGGSSRRTRPPTSRTLPTGASRCGRRRPTRRKARTC